MTFLLPLGLLALLTLPIILLLHLLRERRRRVAVPSLLLWQNLPRKPEGERIRRLPLTFLLLLHLLVAALIGLALGWPQLIGALGGAARQTAIIIDTSTSMAARAGSSTRFALARERARAALNGLESGDRAILIAAGPTARVVASASAADVAVLLDALEQLRPGGTGADIDGALTLAEAAFDQQHARQVLVISDGALPPAPERTLAAPVDWQQVGDDQPNRAIVAFAARPAGANVQVYARAANFGPTPIRTSIALYGDEQALGSRNVSIAAGGETELTWTLPARYSRLRAALDGRDALPQDDDGFLSLAQIRPIKALLVSAQPDTLRRALAAIPGVSVTVIDPANYPPTPQTADLTLFDSFLPQAWPDGAILAINPPSNSALITVGQHTTSQESSQLMRSGAPLEGLGLEGVRFGTPRQVQPPDWATTQLALGDTPLILRGRSGAHEIAIWAFDLTDSNLPTRLAFPLLMARTARSLTPPALPASITAGAQLAVRPDPRASSVELSGPAGMQATVAVSASTQIDALTLPGFYQLEERAGGATLFRGQLAVNAGAAIESDLRARPARPIIGADQVDAGAPQREVRDIWPWLALGALAVLMLEWGYIHR
jgi:hypothetical protein